MAKSFFIGVGGTGSRCLESLVHFCAAGLGPETLNIGIVDQDQSNGNVARARQLVELYSRSRAFFRQPAKNNLTDDHHFLKTDIEDLIKTNHSISRIDQVDQKIKLTFENKKR